LIQSADFNQALILGVLVVLGLTLVCWPLAAIIRGHYHQRLELDASYMRLRPWVRVVCAVDIAFLLIFLMVLTSGGINVLSSRSDFKFQAIQFVGVLGAMGTVVVLLASLRSWRDPQAWFWGKVWNLLLLLACLGFVWFSYHWNLLNFNMSY
jgi:hypothetical protein